jgi:predicted transcriptional regulator
MRKQVFVGGGLREAAKRVSEAWHRVENGKSSEAEDNVTFVSWSALASVMTNKRYELLRHLHQRPAESVRALSRDIGRDFKRVHEDVKALEAVGFIERSEGRLHADYDAIRATIILDSSAA